MEYCFEGKMAANGLPELTAALSLACKEYRLLSPEDKLHPVTYRCFAKIQAEVVRMTSVATSEWSKGWMSMLALPMGYPFPLHIADPRKWHEMNRLALLIVKLSGPTALLKWMIETYLVDCNLCSGGVDSSTLLMLAVSQGDVDNTLCLLAGSGPNRADPRVPSCMKGVAGLTTVLHAAMFQRERKKQTPKIPATPSEFMFHPETNELVKRTVYMVELLLAHGASHTTVWRHPLDMPGVEPFAQVDGLTVVQAAARSGDIDVFRAIVEHAASTSAPVDMNRTSTATFNVRDFVNGYQPFYGRTPFSSIGPCLRTTPCCYTDASTAPVVCKTGHCNAPMAEEMLTRGANPHLLLRNRQGTTFHTTFCTSASSDVGMHMLRRVLEWKHTIIRCINHKTMFNLSEDTFLAIFKLAGIGLKYMADKDTPQIPTMPVRTCIEASPWHGFYAAIDVFWAQRAAAKKEAQAKALLTTLDFVQTPLF